jgi:hypothetical protein
MTAPAPPKVDTRVRVHCEGKRKSGGICGQVLFVALAKFDGGLEIRCPRCDTLTTFR